MAFRISPPRWPCLLCLHAVAVLCTLCTVGCEKDEIRSYTVRRQEQPKVRLLGAIAENGKDQWFFKLVGPEEEVGKHEKDFRSFIETLHFTGKADSPVEWKVPVGWEKGPAGGPLRYATFFVGPKDARLTLAVFKFDQKSSLLDNVNRWCKNDLGREPISDEKQLKDYVKPLQVDGREVSFVDVVGPGARGGGKAPPMAGMPATSGGGNLRAPGPLPIRYKTPEGWVETGPRMEGAQGIRVPILTAFTVGDPAKKTELTVTHMPDMGIPLLAQINRWRGQVGLPSISQAEYDRNPPRKVRVAGIEAPFFDFKGSDRQMLLVPVKRAGENWYLKLLGNPDVVENNKGKFESFVSSVQFNGARDE